MRAVLLDDNDYRVTIISGNTFDECEWKKTIRAPTAKGSRRKATNYIRKHVCVSDYTEVEKHRHDYAGFDHWYLRSD